MTKEALFEQIQQKKSFLCVGLDTDIKKIPTHLLDTEDPIFEFNKQIIDATKAFAVAYKPNIAFYEAMGAAGWASLEKTINYIPKDIFTIADAKRGDIGNTSLLYARAFFDNMNFDSVTVAPYMGSDSVKPFLEFKDKWVILLGVTSNEGGKDFQFLESDGKPLYQHVMETSSTWGSDQNMMYVVGATRPEYLQDIRKTIPNHFLLVPGVGAQGGDLEAVCKNGINSQCGLLINSTRGIIYASSGKDFAEAAHEEAKKLQQQMATFVENIK
ncbi:orotidine-5'-phosphate decarboxylase [Reichenbachiella carrageenanivorans]|uniref:Orotidine 5'-phosphate decarboxylase n=1 Tax=Reichenbachiella carrageenanivorans TaxID=2979869 RepID=A0ABY6D3Z7_9BACT|nr:orotidine-5'-phosphate decarboxylase [Reichenbachiella carrageenanivorans]UXX80857.1 orotidine-5'-phosphate decarboxylase [Reichenbachiella carrageenanivorans]